MPSLLFEIALLPRFIGGVVIAFLSLHPAYFLSQYVALLKPCLAHHLVSELVSPSIVIKIVFLLLSACSLYVAHRQLAGEYGPSLSMRSIVCRILPFGLGPMSSKKFTNLYQRLQTNIPRLPYLGYDLFLGLRQRSNITSQTEYSGLSLNPCLKFLFAVSSLCKHPHDFVFPEVIDSRRTQTISPQSHLQNHSVLYLSFFLVTSYLIAVSLPNFLPETSINSVIFRSYSTWGGTFKL